MEGSQISPSAHKPPGDRSHPCSPRGPRSKFFHVGGGLKSSPSQTRPSARLAIGRQAAGIDREVERRDGQEADLLAAGLREPAGPVTAANSGTGHSGPLSPLDPRLFYPYIPQPGRAFHPYVEVTSEGRETGRLVSVLSLLQVAWRQKTTKNHGFFESYLANEHRSRRNGKTCWLRLLTPRLSGFWHDWAASHLDSRALQVQRSPVVGHECSQTCKTCNNASHPRGLDSKPE